MRFFKNASKTQCKGREKPDHLEGARPKKVCPFKLEKKVTTASKKDEINDIWRSWNEMS